MDVDLVGELCTPRGRTALALADELSGIDPLRAASRMRAAGVESALGAAALTQAELRHKAVSKLGPEAADMLFTRAGLEQATRRVVADRRAQRLHAAGVRRIADLGCGIGSDTLAFARAGMDVLAVDVDPLAAAVVQANVQANGLGEKVEVLAADVTTLDLSDVDGVFCDPARRRATGQRVFTPRDYSPPWDFVMGLAERVPRTVLKVAPGIDRALLPAGSEAEWVSVSGALVEATLWCGPLAQSPRRATVLRRDRADALTGDGTRRPSLAGVRRFVYDPDGAVVRAYLLAELADAVAGTVADPEIAFLYADAAVETPFARCFEVTDVMPFSLKRLRTLLRDRGVGRAEILKRGSALDPDELRLKLKLSGPAAVTILLTRVGGRPTVILCTPVAGNEG